MNPRLIVVILGTAAGLGAIVANRPWAKHTRDCYPAMFPARGKPSLRTYRALFYAWGGAALAIGIAAATHS